MEKYTVESMFGGHLKLRQPKTGYRYTIDPILLCSHVRPQKNIRILDAGCGCGIMPLILGFRHPDIDITGVEIQTDLANIAKTNVSQNNMKARIHIINEDITHLPPQKTGGKFDLIISNPPYKKINSGRLNPDPQKAIARHELKLTISTLFKKSEGLLNPRGQIMVIFPAERLFGLHQAMHETSIRPMWTRFIHTAPEKDAIRVILCGAKNSKSSCRVPSPLYLYDTQGNPTKEHENIFNA